MQDNIKEINEYKFNFILLDRIIEDFHTGTKSVNEVYNALRLIVDDNGLYLSEDNDHELVDNINKIFKIKNYTKYKTILGYKLLDKGYGKAYLDITLLLSDGTNNIYPFHGSYTIDPHYNIKSEDDVYDMVTDTLIKLA